MLCRVVLCCVVWADVSDAVLTRRECSWTRCGPAAWSVRPAPSPTETRNTRPSDSPPAENKRTHTNSLSWRVLIYKSASEIYDTRATLRSTGSESNLRYDYWAHCSYRLCFRHDNVILTTMKWSSGQLFCRQINSVIICVIIPSVAAHRCEYWPSVKCPRSSAERRLVLLEKVHWGKTRTVTKCWKTANMSCKTCFTCSFNSAAL